MAARKYDTSHPPPREPSEYVRSEHFDLDAMNHSLRFMTEDMVEQTIMRGRDFWNQGGPGKIRRKQDFDGVYGVLVLALDTPEIVTGWTEVNSWVRAMQSDQWTQSELQKIRVFEDKEHKD